MDPRWTSAITPTIYRPADAPVFVAWIESPNFERYAGRVRRADGPPAHPILWRWQLLPSQWEPVPDGNGDILAHVTAFSLARTAGEAIRTLAASFRPKESAALPAPVPIDLGFGVVAWAEV